MGFFILLALSFILGGIVLICTIHFSDVLYGWDILLAALCTILLMAGIIGICAYSCRATQQEEMERYYDAKSKYNILLNSSDTISYNTAQSFIKDIYDMNILIDDSKKYKDHWCLGPFYYEEISKLEKINKDIININIEL